MALLSVNKLTPDFVRKVGKLYSTYSRTSMQDVADQTGYTSKAIAKILYRGIAENIFSDKEADIIYDKIVNSFSKGRFQRVKKWEIAFEERKEYKLKQMEQQENPSDEVCYQDIADIDEKIKGIQNLIEVYDSYCISEPDAPTLDELENKIFLLEQKKKQLLQAV